MPEKLNDIAFKDRFWSKVDRSGGCWLWTAGKSDGYGTFWLASRMHRAHRVAYELVIGPVPEGMELDHLCRNRACVNPAHLEPVSQRENIRRGEVGQFYARKDRCPQGHPYDEENTHVAITARGGPNRRCRACARERARARRQKETIK